MNRKLDVVTLSGKEYDKLLADSERLDWLEQQTRKSMTGISFDYVPRDENDPAGWRFMRRHFVSNPAKSLREAIDRTMEQP